MRCLLATLAFGCALFVGRVTFADDVWTDANIVTGLDFSGSIEAQEAEIQIDGIAMAIRSPEVVSAIAQGRYGRIGFMVYVWADGNFPVLSSWQLISSPQEAIEASDEVSRRLRAILDSGVIKKLGALTDLSGAIDFGAAMLQGAPFATNHKIINIVGNGIDNVGESPHWARDRSVAQGITINGVTLGHDRSIYEYFRQEVIGGPTAFALAANTPDTLVEVLARKFVNEIVLNAGPADQPLR
ncbi:MAG: DUF1194 domain-containing protein [Dongiaceae bacterium]